MRVLSRSRRPTVPVRFAALIAAATAALAGAAAWLLDPIVGARRRHRLADWAISVGHKAADAADATSRDVANRTAGLAAFARSAIRSEPVSDPVLEARVRTALGRAARHTGALSVSARDGSVTLSGPALREETPRILAATYTVAGVAAVDDQLDIRDEPGAISALRSPGPQPEARPDILQETWAPATRLLAIIVGTAGVVFGMARGGALGIGAAIAGGLVALRGVTNLGIGRAVGIAGGRRAIDVHKTIEVDAPVEDAYDLWARVDRFPEFMSHVREVRPLGGGRTHWTVAGPAGLPIEFDAIETRRVPNEVIAWKSADGQPIRHSGIVRFEPRPDGRARVDVQLTYNPPAGVAGHVIADLFGVDPKQALDDDMIRFQSLLAHGKTTVHGQATTLAAVTGSEVRIPPRERESPESPSSPESPEPAARRDEPNVEGGGRYPPVDSYAETPGRSE